MRPHVTLRPQPEALAVRVCMGVGGQVALGQDCEGMGGEGAKSRAGCPHIPLINLPMRSQ